MFTGLVQTVGEAVSLQGGRLIVRVQPQTWDDAVQIGESVAVNGCCLTVVADVEGELAFDLSEETLKRTSLGKLESGSQVNIERAMRPIDRYGGHIVQGHVDTTGELIEIRAEEHATVMRFRVPVDGQRYLIDKGSICLDGISLTIVEPRGSEFDVWVIPHTLSNTNLRTLKVGAVVNVEYDVLAKHVEQLLKCK